VNPDQVQQLVLGLTWFVVFLFSTTLHEAGLAFAAYRLGDPTAYEGGQVSLNPWPHIRREPIGMILVPLITFAAQGWMMGWASAPYDPHWAERHPRRAAWKSLAGPAANFSLAILAGILIHAGMLAGVFEHPASLKFTQVVSATAPGVAAGAATFLSVLFSLNLLLGTFNLIPVPPLDGFTAIGVLLPEEAAGRLQSLRHSMGNFTLIGMLIAWKVFDPVFVPLFDIFIKILYPTQSYS